MLAQLQDEIVRGPETHPRFGKSIIVRPTMETPRAGRYMSQAVVVTTAARRLITLSKDGEKLAAVVLQAEPEDRDPTTHPEFAEIAQNLRELTNKWFPKSQFCLISNNPELSLPSVRHALGFFDQPILRLAAGTQKTYAALSGNAPKAHKSLVEGLSRLEIERLIVHTQFVRGSIDNSKDTEVRAWLRTLGEIRPASVHISTLAKAKGTTEKPITKTRMNEIVELVTEKIGVPVEVCTV